ncbi:DUF4386 domain-containing protein [Streptomyces sp. NPDC001970]
MGSTRRTAVAAGVFFLITEIAAIAGLVLHRPVLSDANYVLGTGADIRVLLGGFFEVVLLSAVIGTAVTLYPVVRRQGHGVALGYVCGRLLEVAVIAVGLVGVLSVVTLRQDLAGAAGTDGASLVTVARSLVAIHDWTFLLGPNVVLGANSLLLAYLMYRSRLVPRFITVLGLVGGPLIYASATAVMFGFYDQLSAWGSIAALPVFAREFSLAVSSS